MRALVWIVVTFLNSLFVLLALVRLALEFMRAHDSAEEQQ